MMTRPILIGLALCAACCVSAQAQTVLYVDANADLTPHNGSDWCHAYLTLTDALAAAGANTTIRVANGTYRPGTSRNSTFGLIDSVTISGGHAGCNDGGDERNIARNETILSGDLAGDDQTGGDNSENSYHVVTGSGRDATAVLDGFTITGGNADGSPDHGGGLYIDGGSPTIVNCTFRRNSAGYGGAVMVSAGNDPTFTNCRFVGNSAPLGGAVYADSGSAVFTNCVFAGNWAEGSGGAILAAVFDGTLVNCTFANNTGPSGGGAVHLLFGNNLTFANCILWGNTPNQIEEFGSSAVVAVDRTCIQDGWTGTGNITTSPQFARDPGPGSDGEWGTPDDDYGDLTLQGGSPAIDAGDSSAILAGVYVDLALNVRVLDDPNTTDTGVGIGVPPLTVDMGAYEHPIFSRNLGDVDGDGDVDLEDFAFFFEEFIGPR